MSIDNYLWSITGVMQPSAMVLSTLLVQHAEQLPAIGNTVTQQNDIKIFLPKNYCAIRFHRIARVEIVSSSNSFSTDYAREARQHLLPPAYCSVRMKQESE